MVKKRVFIYGFNKERKVEVYHYLEGEAISVANMRRVSEWLMTNHVVDELYAVDNRYNLSREYKETVRANDFTKNVEFWDMVAREGLLLAKR